MSNVRKKISELNTLPSASLDTVVVGVDNGVTYKIELDILADGVKDRINTLDTQRLSSLESVTSSFEVIGRNIISSSAQITSLGFTSSSIDLTPLNSFTQSQGVLNTAFINGITSRLQTSSFESFSASVDSRIIAATNEQDLTYLVTTSSFNAYTASMSKKYSFITYEGGPSQVPLSGSYHKPLGTQTGNILYNNSTGIYTLPANKTFVLEASLQLSGEGGHYAIWKNITKNRNEGSVSNHIQVNSSSNSYAQPVAKCIVNTDSETQVALVAASTTLSVSNNAPYISAASSYHCIFEI